MGRVLRGSGVEVSEATVISTAFLGFRKAHCGPKFDHGSVISVYRRCIGVLLVLSGSRRFAFWLLPFLVSLYGFSELYGVVLYCHSLGTCGI